MSLTSAVHIMIDTMTDLGLTSLEKGRVLAELSNMTSITVLSPQAEEVLRKAKARLESAGLVSADDDGA